MSNHEESPTRRPYHHGDLRRALIEAGQALLAEEGESGIDLRRVARKAGVSHTAPYRHFADKQALLAAIAEEGFHSLTAAMRTALAAAGNTTREQLAAATLGYIQFGLAAPAYMRIMFAGSTGDRTNRPSLYAASKQAFAELAGIIERGQERGEIIAEDPVVLSAQIWSMIHGLTMLAIEQQIPDLLETEAATHTFVAQCAATLYDGIARRTAV